jgi:hypothetical protein
VQPRALPRGGTGTWSVRPQVRQDQAAPPRLRWQVNSVLMLLPRSIIPSSSFASLQCYCVRNSAVLPCTE